LQNALQIRGLTKIYSETGLLALNNVNIDILSNEIFVLLGPNGAGKSTLINLIVNNIQATAGSINLYGDS